jgi:UDP-N-acetyl-2-amino-2-deoxyglucuronate dehydrogenase
MSAPALPSAAAPAPAPLRFALVGCGNIAPTQAQALRELPELARLTHCADLEPERAAAFAARHGLVVASWAELLADPGIDVISLCTPSGHHGVLAAEALRAGKHVVVEKPMEVSVAACDALLAAQRASGRRLAVISQHRFDHASQTVRRLLDEGALGRLIAADVRIPWYRTQEYYDSGAWRGTWALDGGGCLMNQGIHTLDLLLWLCGPVSEVYARTAIAAHERIEVEDLACATLTFANGALGTLFGSTACYPGFPARLGLHGTEGSAIIEGDELQTLAIRGRETVTGPAASAHALQVATGGTRSAVHHAAAAASAAASATPAPDAPAAQAPKWKWGDAHREQFAEFVHAIRANRDPLVDAVAGRAAVALIHAIYESARLGAPVRLS